MGAHTVLIQALAGYCDHHIVVLSGSKLGNQIRMKGWLLGSGAGMQKGPVAMDSEKTEHNAEGYWDIYVHR